MGEEIILKCPKCGIPLVRSNEHENTLECQMCSFMIGVESWGKQQEMMSPEEMRAIIEKANQILGSPLKRSIKLDITIGGEWASRFAALQAINEGFKLMSGAKLVEHTVKSGINEVFHRLVNLSMWREASQEVVKNGIISENTVSAMYQDILRATSEEIDKDWKIEEDKE